jgi:hypothetical protein
MFRATQCSSSGESISSIHHLVYITLCRRLPGMTVREDRLTRHFLMKILNVCLMFLQQSAERIFFFTYAGENKKKIEKTEWIFIWTSQFMWYLRMWLWWIWYLGSDVLQFGRKVQAIPKISLSPITCYTEPGVSNILWNVTVLWNTSPLVKSRSFKSRLQTSSRHRLQEFFDA